ncbi:hypothetical protein BKH46_00125 [Helicobacter sp. 12S02634-8]|uniref:outer membrane family protein n=1 Tax=Helicobacter sp. 12S02634-8 TaxID=1476199 RepID=UPI000BA67CDF|nr:outer membrane family protein [Helicobacter sp. 12S02634-8]PAF48364.1 hypothetical protein BKH46_00125 [Helicobacter sp. 12S02634-8]
MGNKYSKQITSKILLLTCWGLAPLFGFDFQVSGQASSFSKIGFDTRKYNPQKGVYPTESYATMLGELDLHLNLANHLNITLGGMINTIVYDSTIYQSGEPLASAYIGYWATHSGQDLKDPRFAMVHNAYISYEYNDMFGFKAGRYETQGYDWFSAFNQGGEAYVKLYDTKAWILFSDARASAYNDWFWPYGRYYTSGAPLIAEGIIYTKNGWSISPYIYHILENMNAPGFNISFDSNPDFASEGFRSSTTLVALFPFYQGVSASSRDTIVFNQPLGKSAQTLFIKQHFDINNYHFGAIIYKNFGNANGKIGIYGDPITYNIWTGSIYDLGTSLSNMVGKDALSGFLYVGAHYQSFKWQLLGRLTTSPRADEQSLALYLSYVFDKHISTGLKIEYFKDTTHKGYTIGTGPILQNNNTSDRSHMMMHITYAF